MIVPYPPGGSTDPTGRAFAAWLTNALGQQVVVDNRPGGFTNTTWFGLLAPAGTPKPVINRINSEMRKAVKDPQFVQHLEALGLLPASSSPAEFQKMIRSELERWRKVIREAGITAATAQ
jgi:tripartite-type tricarboxylate transporter receptor subunit TctC